MFKPGMHQIVEQQQRIDFDAIAIKMAGVAPQQGRPMVGFGRKQFIRATTTKGGHKSEVEFFAEMSFPAAPADLIEGYAEGDAVLFQGVSISTYEDADSKHNSGEILSYPDFLEKYISSENTRLALNRVMSMLAHDLEVNDEVLSRMNYVWENREPGQDELYQLRMQ